jgi:16S rRNA (guanine527-N7)-methyltransferase
MIDKQRLEAKCSTWNIALTGTQLDQLDAFAQILVDYNQKVNLTAITDPEGIEDKHFLDSLLFASQPEVAGRMVDVGAGAGFPGIVTKIYKPELEITLMEPTGVLEVRLCPAGPDRRGVCQGARRGSRPQGVAGAV